MLFIGSDDPNFHIFFSNYCIYHINIQYVNMIKTNCVNYLQYIVSIVDIKC